MTGLTPESALIVLLIIVWYIILLLLLIPIHKSLVRLLRRKKEILTWEYDTLRYLVAKAQKQNWGDSKNKWITVLFDIAHPDYLHHHTEIKNEILNIESGLWGKIIDDTKRAEIEKKQKKYRNLDAVVNVYGRCVSVITLFVYRLFW